MAIEYPRKCPHCDYLANSPQSYSYHLRKHKAIPEGTLCDGGCGQLAKYRTTNNRMLCCEHYQKCPQYIIDHKQRVIDSWKNDTERKNKMVNNNPMLDEAARNKISDSQKQVWKERLLITEKDAPQDVKQYKRLVHNISQRTYKDNMDLINPNKHPIGRTEFHLDHKVSKHVGWLLHIPAKYIASVENLEVLPSQLNEGKGAKCSLKPSELLVLCNAPSDLVEQVRSQEILLKHLVEL